jgi:hypothetical protein
MAFKTGLQALQESINAADQRAKLAREGGSSSQGYNYFSWKAGEKKILRFLTDDVLTENFYDFILDKTGSVKTFLVDPADPERLKKYMSPTPGIGWRKNWGTSQLEEPSTRELGVGIAVLRDEVRGADGKLHLQDALTDKVIDNVTFPARFFGVVQQSPSNFWHTLATSCLSRYGTICDRDYEITREGEGFNTKYSIIPLEQDPDLATIEAVQAFYFYGQPYSAEDPQRFLKCPVTIQQWADYFSGEERFQHWLVPDDDTPAWLRASAPVQYPSTAAAPQPPVPAAAAPTPAGGGFTPSGMDEFAKASTHNDEAQALQASGTSFSTLKDTLLKGAKPAQ